MISTLIIIAGILLAIAGCVLCYCLVRAPDGEETPQGFILGPEKTPEAKALQARKSGSKPPFNSKDPGFKLQPVPPR